jgi:hypothetical protein
MKKVVTLSFVFVLLLQGLVFAAYINNGDGTVTDTETGLMWQRETVTDISWQAGLDYADALTLAAYDDWRLPNRNELEAIIHYVYDVFIPPYIDVTAFPGTVSSYYWSSTPFASYNDGYAFCVNFGSRGTYGCPRERPIAVRAVRGGQSQSSGSLIISAPAQAGRLLVGAPQTILWDTAGIAGNVKITLSRQGGKPATFTEVIAESVPNNGSYVWTITGPETFNGALRIEPVSDTSKTSTQSLFRIISPPQNTWMTAVKQSDLGHWNLTLYGEYTDGILPIETTWTSSDPTIATISDNLLTAQKNGYIEVSTAYGGKVYKKDLFVYTSLDASESEGNNSKADADIWQANRFYRGTLPAGDTDYFKFTLSSASIVKLGYLSYSSTADTRVDIYNANDTLMASGTSTNGDSLTFSLGLAAGDYYLKLTPAGDADSTNYYVVSHKVISTLPSKFPVPINLNDAKSGTVNHLNDQTDFTVTLSEPQAVEIDLNPTSTTAKYRVTLLNSGQTSLGQVESLDQTSVSMEIFCTAGSYTIRITPADVVDASNSFTLQLTTSDQQLEKEPNDTSAAATMFDLSQPIMGRFSGSSDVDFYTFILDTPRYLNLTISSPGSAKNFSVGLYKESDQNEIDMFEINDGKTTTWSMGLGIGRYYLKVGSSDADTVHAYTLSMVNSSQTNLEIESNNTKKFATPIEKDKPMKGRIYSASDIDYYGFNLPDEGFITVNFTPSTTTGDYLISLVDENDQARQSKTSMNGAAVDFIESYFERPGNYYIKVEANKTAPNTDIDQYSQYTVSLTSNVVVAIIGLREMASVMVTGTQNQMTIGNTQTLTAKAGYSDTTIVSIIPTWTSLNPAVATVNAAGLVTALAQGTTSIVANYGGLTVKFDLTVGAPPKVVKQHYGSLILVAGGGIAPANTLKESTQYLSDLVYRRFKSRLFADEDIYYFNPMPWHDLDGDGYGENVVDDSAPTVAKLGEAITTWAATQDTDGPLYVYLIDHGGIDNFMIFPGEIVTADQLKGWLETFQTTAPGRKVIVMIEACKSGSFTDNLTTQGLDRVVVTSADDQDSYIQIGGRISFSQFFVDRLLTGDSLNTAYLKAKQQLANMGLPYSKMQPKLVEGVNLSSTRTWLGGDFAIASLFPEITETSPNIAIAANPSSPISFYAKLSSMEGIESVWAVVTDPGYMPSATSGEFEAPTVVLPIFTLADPEKDLKYEGAYQDFIYNGDYRITFYARNTNGNVSASPATVVSVTGGLDTTFKVLTVTKGGAGTGAVTSLPVGIDCGTTCVAAFENGTAVTLTAAAANDSIFTGWSGACTGIQGCNFAMNISRSVTATFAEKLKGDVDGNRNISLADAILALRVTSGLPPTTSVEKGGDVNADGKIGLAEAIYILQKGAGVR